jgi:hypothetical protein
MIKTLILYWLIAIGLAGVFILINLYLDYRLLKKKEKDNE